MAKNNVAPLLLNAKRKGVEQGLYLMESICLIAMRNKLDEWNIPVADEFYGEVEQEMADIFKEVTDSVPSGNAEEMAERLEVYVHRIREEKGMGNDL